MDNYKTYWIERQKNRLPYFENYMAVEILNEKRTETMVPIVYAKMALRKEYFKNLEGQITRNTLFGQTIYNMMVSDTGPKHWVEVGTWNGKGTTSCLLQGLQDRSSKDGVKIQSYEAQSFFYELAKENVQKYSHLNEHFTLIHGRLPSTLPFPQGDFIEEKQEHFYLHYEEEKAIFTTANQVPVPFSPEAVILDGGEYTGYHDWESIPKENLQHIFLDDINIQKNRCVHILLQSLSDWECILDYPTERNGWSYWRRKY